MCANLASGGLALGDLGGSTGSGLPTNHHQGARVMDRKLPGDRIRGYCPMGCGRTLFRGDSGHITCSFTECPDPGAVDTILGKDQTEHLLTIESNSFTVDHPLRER